ncbi:hypothetical protein P8452_55622 [Trifolium repens]|nr:hypothetical protein P8452_55622 [Trifolium repens]
MTGSSFGGGSSFRVASIRSTFAVVWFNQRRLLRSGGYWSVRVTWWCCIQFSGWLVAVQCLAGFWLSSSASEGCLSKPVRVGYVSR